MNTVTPETAYVALVRAIGPGFHPDTFGAEYVTLPDGITAEDVDAIVDLAFSTDVDVYGIGLDIMLELEGEPK